MAGVNWLKMTKPRAANMRNHNGKKERVEKNHSNINIDKSKSDQNFFVGCDDWSDANAKMQERTDAVDKLFPPRKKLDVNERVVCVSLITYCPQAVYDSGRVKDFFELVDKVQRQVFGSENVHGTAVHLDEMHNYIDTDGTERSSLAHGHSLVSSYAEWTDPKSGEERKGINGKNFQTRPKMNELNKAIDEMCRREFGVPYMTGKGKGKGSGKSVEEVKTETQLRMAKKENEDYVRSLAPETTKTTKGFLGKEKIVDKTPEEIERDKEVKAAQAVLKDKDDLAERERSIAEREKKIAERERKIAQRESELTADEEKLAEYAAKCEADANGKVAKMSEGYQQQFDKQAAEFTGQIAELKAEKATLKEQLQRQAKSSANANAIRARTIREKTMQQMGLQIPSGYTVDAQMRAAQQQQQQHIEKGR